jgi:hypothetical protein
VRERYRLGTDYLAIARENVALATEAQNPYQISTAVRLLGMVALCANQFESSELAYREAIQLCEKNNDYNSLLIARVYLLFVHRQMRRVEEVCSDIKPLKDILQKVSRHPQYEGVIMANQAWLALRDGKTTQAHQEALSAFETWKALASPYPMQWIVLFVLFEIALAPGIAWFALRSGGRTRPEGCRWPIPHRASRCCTNCGS